MGWEPKPSASLIESRSCPLNTVNLTDTAAFRSLVRDPRNDIAPHRMAIHQTTTLRSEFDEDLTNYAAAGFKSVGIWRQKVNEFGQERSIEYLLESGLRVTSVSYAGGFTTGWPQEVIDDGLDAVNLAAELRAPVVVVTCGPRSGHTKNHALRLIRDQLCTIAELAAESNVGIAVLPLCKSFGEGWSMLAGIQETMELIRRCNHGENLGLAIDVQQSWQHGDLLAELPGVAAATRVAFVSDTPSVHAADYKRCLPGEGILPWREIIASFEQNGFRGSYELTVLSEDRWRETTTSSAADSTNRKSSPAAAFLDRCHAAGNWLRTGALARNEQTEQTTPASVTILNG